MSLTLSTNLSSIKTQRSLKQSSISLNQAIERMTTGYKINHAKDNAANYSIATNMSSKISAYEIAESNTSMGLDMVQTASITLGTMGDLATRLRALAVQAHNGTYDSQSLNALNQEANLIAIELNRLQSTAEYNGVKLFESVFYSKSVSANLLGPIVQRDTASMTKLSSMDENTAITEGTYSISTAEELAKLATMTNNGKIGANTEFVLADNIDLSAYSTGEGWTPIGTEENTFSATFYGNGYIISNLYINRPSSSYQGLFGYCSNALYDIALENVDVTGDACVGGLAGKCIQLGYCYATGDVTGNIFVGGLAGKCANIKAGYATGSVTGDMYVGGLAGSMNVNCSTILLSYATGDVTGDACVGGLAGSMDGEGWIEGSYATGSVKGCEDVGGLVGANYGNLELDNLYFTDTTGQTNGIGRGSPVSGTADKITMEELDELIAQGVLPQVKTQISAVSYSVSIALQVGVNSSESSQIGLTIQGVDLSTLGNIDLKSVDIFEKLDNILSNINKQQTKLGATENRLMSALESISINYENLVSSRSTIKDADIAEVSSEYIRSQILQQASATLMSTANQTPAIALRLL